MREILLRRVRRVLRREATVQSVTRVEPGMVEEDGEMAVWGAQWALGGRDEEGDVGGVVGERISEWLRGLPSPAGRLGTDIPEDVYEKGYLFDGSSPSGEKSGRIELGRGRQSSMELGYESCQNQQHQSILSTS